MPYSVRLAFDALCEAENDLAHGAPASEAIYSTMRDAVKILFASAGRVSGLRAAKDKAMAALGTRRQPVVGQHQIDNGDDAMASPVIVNDPLNDMTNGGAYLGDEPVSVAARMLHHLEARMPPAAFRGTALAWRERCRAALEPARASMVSAALATADPHTRAARYAHTANSEAINEVVAGSYSTFLHVARIAPAIAPIEDYFTMPVSYDAPGDGPRIMFTISPYYAHSLQEFCAPGAANLMPFRRPTLQNLAVLRSLLAQLLASLASAQHVARYTHYDFHAGNIRVARVRPGMPEHSGDDGATWHYATPARHIYIPATDSRGHVARITDHGRTRVDRPGKWGVDATAAHIVLDGLAPSADFDPAIDTRSLAHDIVFCILSSWINDMVECANTEPGADEYEIASRVLLHRETRDFVDVLEAMTGVHTWTGWRCEPNTARGDPRVLPKSFMQYAVWARMGVVSADSVDALRCREFICRRDEPNPAGAPAAILEMPFFKTYHTPRTPAAVIHDVADFAHVPQLRRVRMCEYIQDEEDCAVAAQPPRGSPVVAASPPARRHPKRARKCIV
jgi:hypothetical protein